MNTSYVTSVTNALAQIKREHIELHKIMVSLEGVWGKIIAGEADDFVCLNHDDYIEVESALCWFKETGSWMKYTARIENGRAVGRRITIMLHVDYDELTDEEFDALDDEPTVIRWKEFSEELLTDRNINELIEYISITK